MRLTRLVGSWRALAACAALVSLSSCDADETSAGTVIVTVTSHAELAPKLRRIRARVYESDATDGGLPVQTQDFALDSTLDAGVQAQLPFSFSITPGRSARFLLVVEGFGSLDPADAPVIEQKQIGAFTHDRTMAMTVMLSESCVSMYEPCDGLEQTCWLEARACGPLREAFMTPASDLRGLDASVLPSRNPPECPPDACDPNYPCTPTPPHGYVCLGARADYPMPYFGSKTPHSYDLSEPGVVVDRVTGLVWQRELPARYEGCNGVWEARGDQCNLDEAKRYCRRLQLGGRAWRLPSSLELATLLDMHAENTPLFDREAFPGERLGAGLSFWSSSTVPYRRNASEPYLTSNMSHALGLILFSSSEQARSVRCVSGVPQGHGVPEERFVSDEAADIVTDRVTKLTWQGSLTTGVRSLDEARAHCAARGPEWRVPNTMELLGILDMSRWPALPEPFFSLTSESTTFTTWTVTTLHDGTVAPLPVETINGAPTKAVHQEFREISADVRCVR